MNSKTKQLSLLATIMALSSTLSVEVPKKQIKIKPIASLPPGCEKYTLKEDGYIFECIARSQESANRKHLNYRKTHIFKTKSK